jgi:hypothetical protein
MEVSLHSNCKWIACGQESFGRSTSRITLAASYIQTQFPPFSSAAPCIISPGEGAAFICTANLNFLFSATALSVWQITEFYSNTLYHRYVRTTQFYDCLFRQLTPAICLNSMQL